MFVKPIGYRIGTLTPSLSSSAKRRQTDPRIVKRMRTSLKQHAINAKKKAAEKLANQEGAPVVKDLWASDDEKLGDDGSEDDDDPIAFHNKITKVNC